MMSLIRASTGRREHGYVILLVSLPNGLGDGDRRFSVNLMDAAETKS
jgi:hypothetical protein